MVHDVQARQRFAATTSATGRTGDERARERAGTVVVGAGAAGLTAAHELRRRGEDTLVLDEGDRVGDSWRARYDSLRLFSYRRFASLPGRPIGLPRRGCPTRDEMADYLENYARETGVPVRTRVRVVRLAPDELGFRLELEHAGGARSTLRAARVVVAAGAHRRPVVPALAHRLDASVRQLDAVRYQGPWQLAPGPVLVVGAGNSGTDIALEARAAGHPTTIAGRHPGQVPVRIDTRWGFVVGHVFLFWLRHGLTVRTPFGRAARSASLGHGVPLVRNKLADLDAAGVRRTGPIVDVRDGAPVDADGRPLEASTVVWATGSRPELGWLDVDGVLDEDGDVRHVRGLVPGVPGLGFVGLDFQFSAASGTIQGMRHDARYVVRRLLAERGNPHPEA